MTDIKRGWTAEKILAWAGRASVWDTDDTAAYLAKCTRLMAAFEHDAEIGNWCSCVGECAEWGKCTGCRITASLHAAIEGEDQ